MAIKHFPQRYPEIGRLRLGEAEPVLDNEGRQKVKNGQKVVRPKKLGTWRVTSHDEVTVKAVAAIYGGDVEQWDGAPEGEQWQVVTETAAVNVMIPSDPLDLAYEAWSKGGRQRRCDGEVCLIPQNDESSGAHFVEQPCWCAQHNLVPGNGEDVKRGACDLVVRLKVVLPDVPGLGVFIMTSGSVYAAMELPAVVSLLSAMGGSGVLVPAELVIEQRTEKKAWEKFKREFPVPVLRVRESMTRLAELNGGGGGGIGVALGRGDQRELTERTSSRRSTIGDKAPHIQAVVYACSDAGLTRDQSHDLVRGVTNGRTESRNDLNVGEAGLILAAIADGTWEQWCRPASENEEAKHQTVEAPSSPHPPQQQVIDTDAMETPPSTGVKRNQRRPDAAPSYADDIHRRARVLELDDEQLDAVIFSITHRTGSAAEITVAQASKVMQRMNDLEAGKWTIDELVAAVEDLRAKHAQPVGQAVGQPVGVGASDDPGRPFDEGT